MLLLTFLWRFDKPFLFPQENISFLEWIEKIEEEDAHDSEEELG